MRMFNKKGFWILIVIILASNATALQFSYTIIQAVTEDIPLDSGNPGATTCSPTDPENVQLRLPFTAQKIRAQACNTHNGKNPAYRAAGLQICTGTNCAPLVYSGSHKGNGILCSPWSESPGDTIKTCSGNERKTETGWYNAYIYTQNLANVTKTEKKLLGNAKDLAAPYAINREDRFTLDPYYVYWNVHMWIDSSNDVYACVDSDRNQICDVDQAYECEKPPNYWDWNAHWYESNRGLYKESWCCGSPSFNTLPCRYYPQLGAICGKNAQNEWKWLSAGNLGQARQLSCPTPISFLTATSTERQREIYACPNMTNQVSDTLRGMPYQNFPAQNKIIVLDDSQQGQTITHEFLCVPNEAKIYECTEDGNVIQEGNLYNTTGEWINQSGIQFCNGNIWVTNLDLSANKKACLAAKQKNTWPGIAWTGSKCCGDPETTPETYNDPWRQGNEGTAGGCYNSTFIPSGSFVDPEQNIINYQGTFFACNQNKAMAYFPYDTGVIPLARPVCGQPLLNATLTGTKRNAICNPYGAWEFTSNTGTTTVRETTWEPGTNEIKKGCCLENQCWDGQKCRNVGEYYKAGDKGYRCQ